jgi:hypothetical protein
VAVSSLQWAKSEMGPAMPALFINNWASVLTFVLHCQAAVARLPPLLLYFRMGSPEISPKLSPGRPAVRGFFIRHCSGWHVPVNIAPALT